MTSKTAAGVTTYGSSGLEKASRADSHCSSLKHGYRGFKAKGDKVKIDRVHRAAGVLTDNVLCVYLNSMCPLHPI